MSLLTVRHTTVYRYNEPVMFRPRESHDLRLIRTHLAITPRPAHLRWLHDSFDNSVAVATFAGTTSELALHYAAESVAEWTLQFLDPADSSDTMKILRAMTHGIREQFTYSRRVEKGVQSPAKICRARGGSISIRLTALLATAT